MKINGKSLSEPYVETIIIPRETGPLVIKARAVLDYKPFERMVQEPKPPTRLVPGIGTIENVEDSTYKKAMTRRGMLRHYWMSIQSLLATPGISFDVISLDNPDTWDKLDEELAKSNFTPFEIIRILNAIMSANGLNDAKLKQAEKDFLESQTTSQVAPSSPPQPSPIAALRTLQSGEPVSAAK